MITRSKVASQVASTSQVDTSNVNKGVHFSNATGIPKPSFPTEQTLISSPSRNETTVCPTTQDEIANISKDAPLSDASGIPESTIVNEQTALSSMFFLCVSSMFISF